MSGLRGQDRSSEQREHIRLGIEAWVRGYYLVRPLLEQTEEQRRTQQLREMQEVGAYVEWARQYWLGHQVWVYVSGLEQWVPGVVRQVHWGGSVLIVVDGLEQPVAVGVRYLGQSVLLAEPCE